MNHRALAAGSLDAAVIAIEALRVIEGAGATVAPIDEGLSRLDRSAASIASTDSVAPVLKARWREQRGRIRPCRSASGSLNR